MPLKPVTETFERSLVDSLHNKTRVSKSNNVCFEGLLATAIMTLSKIFDALL